MAHSHSTPSSITPTEKGLLARIRVASTALSRAERQVAEFLLQKPHDALEMSIRVLAQACDVSEPTVARFCKVWVSMVQIIQTGVCQKSGHRHSVSASGCESG
jgi:hypothetical protein